MLSIFSDNASALQKAVKWRAVGVAGVMEVEISLIQKESRIKSSL